MLVYNDKYPNMTSCHSANMSLTVVEENKMLKMTSCLHETTKLTKVIEVLPNKSECSCENSNTCRRFFDFAQQNYLTQCDSYYEIKFDLCLIRRSEKKSGKKSKNLRFLWSLVLLMVLPFHLWLRRNRRPNVQVGCLV